MRRHRHRQRQGTFCAFFFGQSHRGFHRGRVTCYHHLTHGIEIHRFHHFATVLRQAAHVHHVFIAQAQNRRHRAHALWHGILHQVRAFAHQLNRGSKIQALRCHQSGVLAQAVACQSRRRCAAQMLVSAPSGHTCRQHQRLGNHSRIEFGGIVAIDHGPQVFTQLIGSLLEGMTHHTDVAKTIHHVQRL